MKMAAGFPAAFFLVHVKKNNSTNQLQEPQVIPVPFSSGPFKGNRAVNEKTE